MPIGLAFINLRINLETNEIKGILEASYPEEFNISRALINKVSDALPENISIKPKTYIFNYNNKIILTLSSKINSENIEVILIIIDHAESKKVDEFRNLMTELADSFYSKSKIDRVLEFDEYAKQFFTEKSSKKLLIIGFPGAGKTCIKKAFFEGEDPKKLLTELGAPEPTMGVQHFSYSWLDTEVGMVDSSGQEFERYISGDIFEKEMTFGSSDAIVYVFDINNWMEEQEIVIENLEKVINVRDELTPSAKIYAFCHKIDIITLDSKTRATAFSDIKDKLQKGLLIKTVFTSIDPRFIHTLFRSLQIILNDLSKVGTSLESFIRDVLLKMSKTSVILLDDKFKVISERRTEGMSIYINEEMVKIAKNLNETYINLNSTDLLDFSLISSYKGLNILIKRIHSSKFGMSYIIIGSKTASKKALSRIIEILEEKITINPKSLLMNPLNSS